MAEEMWSVGASVARRRVRHVQKPEKLASFAGSFDMAPMNQYAVVCHIESSSPHAMYRHRCAGYALSWMSILSPIVSRVYPLHVPAVSHFLGSALKRRELHPLLIKVRPCVDDENHDDKHGPSRERTEASRQTTLV